MGRKVGNIFFIGEYTSIGHPASMNSAVRSAYKVFNELKENILSEIPKSTEELHFKTGLGE
ncbi:MULTISPECIES: hypothetical protein [unclassified Legionella]|uniref:hypothetical protein n=1 Tax=unclassified Legionella TaxID=2622702 RepID=UPI001056AEEC|nr:MULTISPECIES: hypothetical protein [unclassified Legionella]MDI9817675.1 hypothetical protein [Legionella sp. PL877]